MSQLDFKYFYLVVLSFFLLLGIIYVGNTWSPSSYALVLKNTFHSENTGLIAGTPRCIRSDEFAVLTPFTQATVNNRLARYNETSYYREDLRVPFSLPILDWGILFKPTMWLYPFVNPAYAFSFHHYALIFLFLFGYTLLFVRLGSSHFNALLLSFIAFFTGFTQYWWTALGPILAFFPWVIISLELKVPFFAKIFIFYWVATCWILSTFYPPVIISLAFVALLTLLAFRPELLCVRSILGFGAASIASVATASFYLMDYLVGTWETIYPGHHTVRGGGLGFNLWISQFLPTSQIHNHGSLIGLNISEIATVGTFYFLLTISFLNYARWREPGFPAESRRVLLILGIGVLSMYAWMLFPLPSWVGVPFLWNWVSPSRMLYAVGLVLLLVAFICASSFGFRLTWTRFAVFTAITVIGWYQYKWARFGLGLPESWLDVIVVLPAGMAVLFARRIGESRINTAMLGISLLMGLLAFGTFNPLQSSWPIFNRIDTPVTRMLDDRSAADPQGTLAIASDPKARPGAVLNGWGYRSVSHVLVMPRIDIWREKFPAISDADLNQLFNRYAHIILTVDNQPKLLWADAVATPIKVFRSTAPLILLPSPC